MSTNNTFELVMMNSFLMKNNSSNTRENNWKQRIVENKMTDVLGSDELSVIYIMAEEVEQFEKWKTCLLGIIEDQK